MARLFKLPYQIISEATPHVMRTTTPRTGVIVCLELCILVGDGRYE